MIKLKEGWEEGALYLVDVSFNQNNPIHRSVLFSGFLRDGEPGNYHMICNTSYERNFELKDVYYVKVIKKLASKEDFKSSFEMPPKV